MIRLLMGLVALTALGATPVLALQDVLPGHEGHAHATASASVAATASAKPDHVYVCPMRCVPPQAQPGECAKCGMTLRKRKA